MPIQSPPVSTTKNRPLPVGPDDTGMAIRSSDLVELLAAIYGELKTIRLILADGFEIDLTPADVEDEE